MTLILVGLNHRTAPVELREKLSLSVSELQLAYLNLKDTAGSAMSEIVILSTCNRFEIYAETDQDDSVVTHIEQFLSHEQPIIGENLKMHLYVHHADEVVNHLMHVACGLDSMILGESQILGQVTQAFETARQTGMTGSILSHLFAQAIHAGKRARTESSISRHTMSVSHAAVLLLQDALGQRTDVKVMVIGAGEMASLAAQALKHFGMADLTFINRTYDHAEALAQKFGGKALAWSQLGEGLIQADAVITATNAPHTVIGRQDIEAIQLQRQGRPLLLIDIAVPRDVDENVRELASVRCYNIDELQSVVDGNRELRKAAIPEVERIIQQEMTRFTDWNRGREVTPVIKNLREWAENIADEELDQTLNRLSDADVRTRQIVSRMAHRLVNRLLHEPTSRLQMQASEGNGYGYAQAVRELFALDDVASLECQHDETRCTVMGQGIPSTRLCNLQCILPTPSGHIS